MKPKSPDFMTWNHRTTRSLAVLALALLAAPAASAGIVSLTPGTINGLDTATTQYSDANVTLTPLRSGTPATFNAGADRLGIDDFGTNPNAFNDLDMDPNNGTEEQLRFVFAANAGLTTLSWDYSRADGPDTQSGVNISGFAFDPRISLTGPGTSPATYNATTGTLNIQLSSAAFSDTDGVLTLDPGASAGATLLMTVTDTTQDGAQLAVTGISYEDNVTTKAPVINQPLPATVSTVVGLSRTLSVALEPGTLPAPTFLWEFNNGGGFVTVGGNTTSYTFTAGAVTDGTYRVTVRNSVGSDSSTSVVSSFEELANSNRNSIGITFASTAGDGANINLGPLALAGAPGYVQRNWNATSALAATPLTATKSDILTPAPGGLVNSSGAASSATFSIQSIGAFSRLNNPQSAYGGLFSGYLFTNSDTAPVLIDLTDVPYTRYDVVVYVMGFNQGVQGTIEDVNAASGPEYAFRAPAILAAGQQPNWFRSADQTAASNGSNANFPVATHVIFRGLTGTSQSFNLNRIFDNPGVAAIQIVEDLDTDGDGMGDFYEASVGLNPNDNGSINPLQAPGADFDGDTLSNISEHNNGTNPNNPDTDGDGIRDDRETDTGAFVSSTNTGTDPRMPDTDLDSLLDGVEIAAGTDPFVSDAGLDSDEDGWSNVYEVGTGMTDPLDADSPGAANPPNGFAIAFNSAAGAGAAVQFGPLVAAGAPGVKQKNWNRTSDLGNNEPADATGDIAFMDTPNSSEIVNSSGAVIGNGTTGVGVQFTAGRGAWSGISDASTPYGRLFNSFIYGTTQTTDPSWTPTSSVTLTGIPYSSYSVYVYFGSETNNRIGTISSSTAGVTYSFTTQVNSGVPGIYRQTTDTGSGNPIANYAVFSGQTSSTFTTTVTVGADQNSMGIHGIQVVDTTGAAADPVISLSNPQKSGNTFTADFTTNTAGTFIFERSQTLENPWTQIGSPLSVSPGTSQVTDPAAPAGKAFYRVREP